MSKVWIRLKFEKCLVIGEPKSFTIYTSGKFETCNEWIDVWQSGSNFFVGFFCDMSLTRDWDYFLIYNVD